jgi:hypothetical protein
MKVHALHDYVPSAGGEREGPARGERARADRLGRCVAQDTRTTTTLYYNCIFIKMCENKGVYEYTCVYMLARV